MKETQLYSVPEKGTPTEIPTLPKTPYSTPQDPSQEAPPKTPQQIPEEAPQQPPQDPPENKGMFRPGGGRFTISTLSDAVSRTWPGSLANPFVSKPGTFRTPFLAPKIGGRFMGRW